MKALRKCQKKGKGKGKGKAPPKSKEIIDSDSGADSYDLEMYPEAAAAQNRAAEESAVGASDGIPCYLRCFVNPTSLVWTTTLTPMSTIILEGMMATEGMSLTLHYVHFQLMTSTAAKHTK